MCCGEEYLANFPGPSQHYSPQQEVAVQVKHGLIRTAANAQLNDGLWVSVDQSSIH